MADYLSINEFPGTGAIMQVEVNFAGNTPDAETGTVPYFKIADVKAEFYVPPTSMSVPVTTPATLTYVGPNTFKTVIAVPVGTILRVYRETEDRYALVNFNALQNVTEADLDALARQVVFLAEEAKDTGEVAEAQAGLAIGYAVASNAQAAAATAVANEALANSNTAIGTANTAASQAAAAVVTANQAALDAASAEQHASNVEDLAQAATDLAAAANSNANSAVNTANQAAATANGIAGTANAAQSAAANAVTIANTANTTANQAAATANAIDAKATQAQTDAASAVTTANNAASAVAGKADLASPAFTGNPTAPNQAVGDSDTSIANTAFVQAAMAAFGLGSLVPAVTDLDPLGGGVTKFFRAGSSALNIPVATAVGGVYIGYGATAGVMICGTLSASGTLGNKLWWRNYNNSIWGTWTLVAAGGANNDITSLSALTTPLTTAQGGPAITYIDGLIPIFGSTTSLLISPGAAYIPGLGRALAVPTQLTLSLTGLVADSWYHVYLYSNSGAPALELVQGNANPPAAAYAGTARCKTGDTTRRWLFTFRTFGTALPKFRWYSNYVRYMEQPSAAPLRVAAAAGLLTTPGSISLGGVIPVTTTKAFCQVVCINAAGAVDMYIGIDTYPGSLFTYIGGNVQGIRSWLELQTNTTQAIQVWSNSNNSTYTLDVFGYGNER